MLETLQMIGIIALIAVAVALFVWVMAAAQNVYFYAPKSGAKGRLAPFFTRVVKIAYSLKKNMGINLTRALVVVVSLLIIVGFAGYFSQSHSPTIAAILTLASYICYIWLPFLAPFTFETATEKNLKQHEREATQPALERIE